MNLTANERRALMELAKPVGSRDYSRVHGITRHALERKGLFGSNGKPGGAITAAGRAELEIPNIFDNLLFAAKAAPMKSKTSSPDVRTVVPGHAVTYHNEPTGKKQTAAAKKEPADEFRAIAYVETTLYDTVRDRWDEGAATGGVRLYNTAGAFTHGKENARWALQVRAQVKTKHSGPGKHFAVGTASMSREDLAWLRDLINVELRRAT
jgi:hypothetical protein